MKTTIVLALGLSVAALSLSPAAVAPQQPPTFSTGVELVYVDAFVSHDGRPLGGLTAGDFEVLDDGVPQTIELVLREQRSVYAILLLDTSGSVAGEKLEQLRGAARAFLEDLGKDDRAVLLTFSHEVRLHSSLTALPSEVEAALEAVQVGGATSLYDAVYAALSLADPTVGRPVVLVFSDGEDRLSLLPPADVVTVARESEASIFAVELRPSAPGGVALPPSRPEPGTPARTLFQITPGQDRGLLDRPDATAEQTASFLNKVVAETGGRLWRTADAPELRPAFLQVLEEVKNRYLLRYEPQAVNPTGWHKLEVRLRKAKGSVRARSGYLAQRAQ
ncbi:MAG TPA: VWA domain-containing protein [Vicinamibacteria bacterium]|nr:VWA domain-containing protein [Vicinamibacteria bacterium]